MDAATLDVLDVLVARCSKDVNTLRGRPGGENAGEPLKFVPLQAENLDKHDACRTPWSAAGRWA